MEEQIAKLEAESDFLIFDTPGLLWPEMSNQTGAYRLATSGAIGANALDYTNVGLFAAEFMMRRYPELMLNRYKFEEMPPAPYETVEAIGRSLGCLVSGGVVNMNRAAEAFLRELRAGKIGRVSLEEPATAAICDMTMTLPELEV